MWYLAEQMLNRGCLGVVVTIKLASSASQLVLQIVNNNIIPNPAHQTGNSCSSLQALVKLLYLCLCIIIWTIHWHIILNSCTDLWQKPVLVALQSKALVWIHSVARNMSLNLDGLDIYLLCLLFVVDSDLCNKMITHSEESYCVCLSDYVWPRNIKNEVTWAQVGLMCH